MVNRPSLPEVLLLPALTLATSFIAVHTFDSNTQNGEALVIQVCCVSVFCSLFLLIRSWRLLREQTTLGLYLGFTIYGLFLPIRALPSSEYLARHSQDASFLQILFQWGGSAVMLYFASRPVVAFCRRNWS